MKTVLALASGSLLAALPVVLRNETLGPPVDGLGSPIAIAAGSGTVVAGIGLSGVPQPAAFSIQIPATATVKQVFAYWTGETKTAAAMTETDAITLNGQPVVGLRVGGPDFFFTFNGENYTGAYRADITGLNLVGPGSNNISVAGVDFAFNLGLGLVAIIQDGAAAADIQLRDGNDNAFVNFPEPRKSTVPQVFTFAAAAVDRTASLSYLVGSVGANRPNVIQVTIGGVPAPIRILDALQSAQGTQFDAYAHTVNVPAGATSLTVEIISEDGNSPPTGHTPASLNWIAASLALAAPQIGGEGCTPGYWKNHKNAWPAPLVPSTTLGVAFGFSGIPSWQPTLDAQSMILALQGGGGSGLGGATKILMRAATAALLNATSSNVNYPLTINQVKLLVLDELSRPADSLTRERLLSLATRLDILNNLGCR
ncbi:MAG: hypothetical protein H6836_04475 [Planctomycetes bacterium]|nr:hypothetical protein [Planctomycetota bacterium]MCB9888810.1 hypothetical protein [Planctomycetota bacterium]